MLGGPHPALDHPLPEGEGLEAALRSPVGGRRRPLVLSPSRKRVRVRASGSLSLSQRARAMASDPLSLRERVRVRASPTTHLSIVT
jgi:hypothetical protein